MSCLFWFCLRTCVGSGNLPSLQYLPFMKSLNKIHAVHCHPPHPPNLCWQRPSPLPSFVAMAMNVSAVRKLGAQQMYGSSWGKPNLEATRGVKEWNTGRSQKTVDVFLDVWIQLPNVSGCLAAKLRSWIMWFGAAPHLGGAVDGSRFRCFYSGDAIFIGFVEMEGTLALPCTQQSQPVLQ